MALLFLTTSCAIYQNKIRYINSANSSEGSSIKIHEEIVLEGLDDDEYYTSVDWSPVWDRKRNVFIVAGTNKGKVKIWKVSDLKKGKGNIPYQTINIGLETNKKINKDTDQWYEKGNEIRDVAWSPTGDYIALGIYPGLNKKGNIGIINVRSEMDGPPILGKVSEEHYEEQSQSFKNNGLPRRWGDRIKVIWSPDGKILSSMYHSTYFSLHLLKPDFGTDNTKIHKINVTQFTNTISADLNESFSIAWSSNTKIFALKNTLYLSLWKINGIQKLLDNHPYREEYHTSLIEIERLSTSVNRPQHFPWMQEIKWSPNDRFIAVSKTLRSIGVKDFYIGIIKTDGIADGSEYTQLEIDTFIDTKDYKPFALDWSPDSKYIVIGAHNGKNENDLKIIIWDLHSEESMLIPTKHKYMPLKHPNHLNKFHWTVAWSPDGKFIATTTFGKTLRIWPVEFKQRN